MNRKKWMTTINDIKDNVIDYFWYYKKKKKNMY